MRPTTAHRVLLVAIGSIGVAAGACFSSSSGGPSGDDGGGIDASPDVVSDSTLPSEAGQPEASPEASVEASGDAGQESGSVDSGASPDAAEAGGPGILLPGQVQAGTRIVANHTTSKFYVAWANTSATPRTYGVSVIDAKTGAITGTLDVQAVATPFVDETNDLVYVPTHVLLTDGASSFTPLVEVFDGTNTLVASKTIYQAQGQTLDAGQAHPLANLGMDNVVVDPGNDHLFALLGDGSGNSYVVEYDTTSGTALASVTITGSEPVWGGGGETGGGLVLDGSAHTLWVVTGTRQSFGAGAVITTIDTSSFTVTSSGAKQAANATDVAFDPASDQALVLMPEVAIADAGGTLPTPGAALQVTTTGATSTALTPPPGLAALFGRVLGPSAYVYANSDAGSYYLLGYTVPDAGAWSLHGQSTAIAPQPQPGPFETGSVLNAYSFEVVTDSTNAYVIATMDYDTYDGVFTPSTFSTAYVQYWTVPLP